MVFQNKIVAAIKVSGQVLREIENTVTIPFGSEYSILVKNLNSVRTQIKISVDGDDATCGSWLVIQPNNALELERFIRHGNWDSGNRFKFIERTKQIEDHRGIRADDGIVRVEYQTERVRPIVDIPIIREHYYHPPRPYPYRPFPPRMRTPMASATRSRVARVTASASSGRRNDRGITVSGSRSDQRFVSADWFETTGQSEVLILHLRGTVAGKAVAHAVTVKTKLACLTCGKSSKAGIDFCSGCGTALSPI